MYTAFDEALKLFLDLGIKGFEIYPYHKVGKGIPLDLSEILNKYFNDINNKYELINGIRGTDCHFQSAKMPAVGEYTTDKEIVIKLNEVSKKNS